MLIDWHTHVQMPEHFADGGEMSKRVRTQMTGTPEEHKKHVADTCEKFVILALNFKPTKVFIPNEFVAEYAAQYGDRVKTFACVDPLEEDAPRQLEHAVRELGMRGLKISPVYGGFDPWCEGAWRVYEVCDRLGIPILWHQSAAYASGAFLEYGNPILLDRIGREFPKIKMIVAHVGQPWTAETVVLMRKHPQIFTDLSARFHRKWQLYNALMLALDYGVTDRILFGSDFPVRTSSTAMDEFRMLNDWGEGVTMPKFPEDVIEDIITNRPFDLIWPEG